MLCSKERIQQLRQMAKDAWERSGQPERSLNVLARAFHQDFNYATRHMLLERVFQLELYKDCLPPQKPANDPCSATIA